MAMDSYLILFLLIIPMRFSASFLLNQYYKHLYSIQISILSYSLGQKHPILVLGILPLLANLEPF